MSLIWTFLMISLLYGLIQAIELAAILARIAGVKSDNKVLGYSVQQSVYMATRLMIVCFLPLLGFVVDVGVSKNAYHWLSHLSLVAACGLGFFVILFRARIVNYFSDVVQRFSVKKSGLFKCFFFCLPGLAKNGGGEDVREIFNVSAARKVFLLSLLVYSIYSCGVFISFYLALIFPEHKVSLSQVSGVVNALAAFLLAFVIEPRIATEVDGNQEFSMKLLYALLYGRFISVFLVGHLIFLAVFYFI